MYPSDAHEAERDAELDDHIMHGGIRFVAPAPDGIRAQDEREGGVRPPPTPARHPARFPSNLKPLLPLAFTSINTFDAKELHQALQKSPATTVSIPK